MSQPFRQTATQTGSCTVLLAEGQGMAKLLALASHSENGGGC